jgi:3-oxoacyl-[acyl-carrier protein] reductase
LAFVSFANDPPQGRVSSANAPCELFHLLGNAVVLSKELGPRQIRVNAISPGATDTEGAHAVGAMTDQAQERYASLTPLARVGKPKDIAQLAVFLASDESSWITGEVIHASGGLR